MTATNPDRRRLHQAKSEPIARLLIAEDDANYGAYLVRLAQRLGFTVDTAADGAAALDQLARVAYDVAIVDFEMPRLNGIEVVTRIRTTEALTDLYTVMLTAREDVATKLTALNAGFDDFITKSSSEPELLAKLSAARRVAARQRNLDSAVRELYGLATHDELTGVFNRRLFTAETDRLLRAGSDFSIVLFDLDGFKRVNDTFGHPAGDQVLRDVGDLFQRQTRPDDLVARYGGDEFVMIVLDLRVADVARLAERLATEVRKLQWRTDAELFGISVSTGIACSRLLPGPTRDRLIEVADRDLYKNKWLQQRTVPPEQYVSNAASPHQEPVTLTSADELRQPRR